ncbi:hypothetical protein AKJ16_DCAP19352 [Drosera capensis]
MMVQYLNQLHSITEVAERFHFASWKFVRMQNGWRQGHLVMPNGGTHFPYCHGHGWRGCSQLALCNGISTMVFSFPCFSNNSGEAIVRSFPCSQEMNVNTCNLPVTTLVDIGPWQQQLYVKKEN